MSDDDGESISSNSGSKESSSEQLAAKKSAKKEGRSEATGSAKKPQTRNNAATKDNGDRTEKSGQKPSSGEAGRSAEGQAIPHSVDADANKPSGGDSGSSSGSDSSGEPEE
jgi:hypothetical protein